MLKKMGQRLKNQKGLTLIELLAVIVILGIIAAIAIPSIGGIIQKSKEDAMKSEAIQILNAAKLHISSNGIPDAETPWNQDVLKSYIEGGEIQNYTVTVTPKSEGAPDITIKTGKLPVGKKHIEFDGASLDDINKNDVTKVKITKE